MDRETPSVDNELAVVEESLGLNETDEVADVSPTIANNVPDEEPLESVDKEEEEASNSGYASLTDYAIKVTSVGNTVAKLDTNVTTSIVGNVYVLHAVSEMAQIIKMESTRKDVIDKCDALILSASTDANEMADRSDAAKEAVKNSFGKAVAFIPPPLDDVMVDSDVNERFEGSAERSTDDEALAPDNKIARTGDTSASDDVSKHPTSSESKDVDVTGDTSVSEDGSKIKKQKKKSPSSTGSGTDKKKRVNTKRAAQSESKVDDVAKGKGRKGDAKKRAKSVDGVVDASETVAMTRCKPITIFVLDQEGKKKKIVTDESVHRYNGGNVRGVGIRGTGGGTVLRVVNPEESVTVVPMIMNRCDNTMHKQYPTKEGMLVDSNTTAQVVAKYLFLIFDRLERYPSKNDPMPRPIYVEGMMSLEPQIPEDSDPLKPSAKFYLDHQPEPLRSYIRIVLQHIGALQKGRVFVVDMMKELLPLVKDNVIDPLKTTKQNRKKNKSCYEDDPPYKPEEDSNEFEDDVLSEASL